MPRVGSVLKAWGQVIQEVGYTFKPRLNHVLYTISPRSAAAHCERQHSPLIRINPREPRLNGRDGTGLALGALEALRGIEVRLQ